MDGVECKDQQPINLSKIFYMITGGPAVRANSIRIKPMNTLQLMLKVMSAMIPKFKCFVVIVAHCRMMLKLQKYLSDWEQLLLLNLAECIRECLMASSSS